MTVRVLVIVAAAACIACSDRGVDVRYELTNAPRSVSASVDGAIRLLASHRIEWQRTDSTGYHWARVGTYEIRSDTIRVRWTESNNWGALGPAHSDTLELSWYGAFDEFHREVYVRR